jgi:hypothetical protein
MLTALHRAARFSALVALAHEQPPAQPEARALWHLEIGYEPQEPQQQPPHAVYSDDDGYDGDYRDPVTCWACGGEGFEIICCDDLCHGVGYCIHGDGERTCRECHGEGVL